MFLLSIFQHGDGTFAWDNLLILLIVFLAGYLLHRFNAKKTVNNKFASSIAAWESKYKSLENEFKSYKSNIAASDKHNEKLVIQLNGRVKALEGDIRALSDEKNKSHQQLILKDEELKKYSKQVAELDDNLKTLRDSKLKADAESSDKLNILEEELVKANVWEQRVKSAEEEAQKAKAAIGNAERKKLEAELRLKATTEYAGKVVPLENELKSVNEKYLVLENSINDKMSVLTEMETKIRDAEMQLQAKDKLITELQEKLSSTTALGSQLKITMAQLELQKENNNTLQKEFELKHNSSIALVNEIDYLKTAFKKLVSENELLKAQKTGVFTGADTKISSGI